MATFTNELPKHTTFADLKRDVVKARRDAEREAKGYGYRIVRSRGTFISTIAKGEQAAPNFGAEAWEWDGTKKSIFALINTVTTQYPEVDEIVIEGGFNGGNSFQDFEYGDYQPWASAWSVTVWTK